MMRSKCKNLLFFISILFLFLSTPLVTHASDENLDDRTSVSGVNWQQNATQGTGTNTTGQS